MKTLIANIGLVKRLKSSVSPKGKQRAIAVLLAVATLLTALVVIPITLPATVAGAVSSNDVYTNNTSAPGAFYTGNVMTSYVFYAKAWYESGKTIYSGNSSLFSGAQNTQTGSTENTIGYHSTEEAFVFRAKSGTSNPYVFFRPCKTSDNTTFGPQMGQLDGGLGKHKYVTITYAVYNNGGTNTSSVNFRIYGLLPDGTGVSGTNNCMDQPIITNEKDSDTNRTYRTIIFDLSGCDWWSGAQVGLRLDYFVSTKNNPSYTANMVMFIDSIGFFETMDEAKMHERERDWARNAKRSGKDERYLDRHIFRASDGNWDGYFGDTKQISSRSHDKTQNTYKIEIENGADPYIHFVLNGNTTAHGTTNQVKRHFTNVYSNYVGIRMKIKKNDTTTGTPIETGAVQLRMYTTTALQATDASLVVYMPDMTSQGEGYVPNDEYFTAWFSIQGVYGDYMRGFRFDPMTNAEDGSFTVYVESIIVCSLETSAVNHGTESLKLDAEDMDTYIDRGSKSWHELTTSIETVDGQKTLKLQTDNTKACTGVCKLESEVEGCDTYCKLFAAQASSLASGHVIDPYVTLTIPNGGIRVSSHPYMVITYYVSKDNDGENTLSYSNCTPNISTAYSQLNQTNYYETYNAHPFSFFPSGYAKNGTSINAAEINRTQLWVSESQLGTFITAYIELAIQDSNENEADLITKIRIDPYNRHIVKNNKSMNIASIGFYNSLEGIDEFENDQYPYSFELTLDENIDSNSSQTNTYTASNFEMKMTQTLSSDALDTSTGEVKYTFQINNENIRFYRDNYKFIGWGIKDAEGNITEMLTLNDETHAYEVTLTIDTNSDEPYATTSSNTKLYKATLTVYAVWQLQTGALTITQDKEDATSILRDGDRMVYMINGETKDNAVIPFTDLYVSAQFDPNGNIVVHLPVGEYTIQCIDGWNWRYTATAATAKISAAETYMVSEGKLSITKANNAKTGNVDFTKESNSSWLNGYGYAAKDIPATDS